ncbi:uncharacterized protein [Nicotiana sylvestris]|uniref:uncharacterized protein n=1 Tax=Nicotiana sylvestris TaxID=4096 RepID=UPI00388CA45C
MGRIKMMFEQMMKKNADSDAPLASYNTSIRNFEVQLSQISQSLNTFPKGALPSDTVVNPKDGNNVRHVMAVTTRSGRGGNVNASKQKEILRDEVDLQEDDIPLVVENVTDENVNELAKQKNENQFKKFIDMMKSLSINLPLVEALEQMPGYAKFMKNLVIKKRSMDCETIKITHQVSAIVHSMALKLEDPDAFTIGSANFAKALCDLGASINLIPYSVFKTLGIGKPRETTMRLQMANRTMKRPLGIVDDVLVRVDKFILPTDFVILVCEVDYKVLIILG